MAQDAPVEVRARADIGRELHAAAAEQPATEQTPAAQRAALASAAQTAAAELPASSLVRATLEQLVVAATSSDAAASAPVRDLRTRLQRVADDLAFAPLRQAPVPEDWPAPAPVGDVAIKQYPAYRMAQAPMRSVGDMSAFWKLFRHIQSNDIPMTAPVQMDHAAPAANSAESGDRVAMGFLYESTNRGNTGTQGDVEVVDVPAARYVAIGARGYENEDDVAELQSTLRQWLAAHGRHFEVCGPMRLMGWNGPSVRGNKRFYEVELPIRLRRDV